MKKIEIPKVETNKKESLKEELIVLANEKISNMKSFIKELNKDFYTLEELKEISEQWGLLSDD